MKFTLIFTLWVSLLSAIPQSDLDFVDSIAFVFRTKYANRALKEERYGWNLDERIAQLKEGIVADHGLSRKAILRFFNSLNDLHVSCHCYSTAYADLPFDLIEIDGKYYVCSVHREFLDQISPGDQMIEWNEEPMASYVERYFRDENPFDSPSYGKRAQGIYFLTRRIGEFGMEIPSDEKISITTITHDGKRRSITLDWLIHEERHIPFGLDETDHCSPKGFLRKGFKPIRCDVISPLAKSSTYKMIRQGMLGEVRLGEWGLGDERGFLPTLGKAIWKGPKGCSLLSYIFKLPNGKQVGVIRIPGFDSDQGYEKTFGQLIAKMEKNSDGLILDTTGNSGGSVFTVYEMVRHLSNQPLKLLPEEKMWGDDDIYSIEYLHELLRDCSSDQDVKMLISPRFGELSLNLKECEGLRAFTLYTMKQWRQGKQKVDLYPIYGFDKLEPAKICYTKPILVLTNRMQVSGGDLFPAILKDNGRAVLMGERTAGGGASIISDLVLPNRLGIHSFSTSNSTVYSPNGNLVEDVGVEPDIEYNITPEDLASGYEGYRAAILDQIDSMIPQKAGRAPRRQSRG